MKINSYGKSVSEIFSLEGTDIYKIPSYQRDYSWKTEQLETFIDDIKDEEEGYYIGNLLTTSKKKGIIEIVDGQQRLTTIALLFLGMFEVMQKFAPDENRRIGKYESKIREKLLIESMGDIQRYELLPKDNKIFSDLLSILNHGNPSKHGNVRFYKRYKEVVEKLDELNFDKLIEFFNKLNSVQILIITVESLNDAYSIFSALNSKGLKLTLIDLLKNEYLSVASSGGIKEDEAVKLWYKFVEIFSEQDLNEVEVTQFLLNNYDGIESETRSSTTKGKALKQYEELLDKKKHPYLETLGKRAEWFLYLKHQTTDKHHDKDVNKLVKELVSLDASQSFPLLLLIFAENVIQISDEDLKEILIIIKKFFVIRNVTLRPKASNVRSMFINIIRDIEKNALKGKDLVDHIVKEISSNVDNNSEFKTRLMENSIYEDNKNNTRFILISLEREYGKDFFNKANLDSLDAYIVNKKVPQWSIEHILPQGSLPNHWLSELSLTEENVEEFQTEFTHRLGNLTLTPYNPEMGQKSFTAKRDQRDENGNYSGLRLGVFLNKSIAADGIIENQTKWDRTDIKRRSEILADKVVELFGIKD